jgi:hypothetical protein
MYRNSVGVSRSVNRKKATTNTIKQMTVSASKKLAIRYRNQGSI